MAAAALRLRSDLKSLTAELTSTLNGSWTSLDDQARVETLLRDILPDLIDTFGLAAASLTADWYDNERERLGAPGRFTAIPAEIANSGSQALIGFAASSAVDLASFQSIVLGGSQRRVMNFSRATSTQSAIADPGARGWKRVGVGECDFCRLLIGRGAVYTEASVEFDSHDRCHCVGAPDFL